jgi:hypothetical protein
VLELVMVTCRWLVVLLKCAMFDFCYLGWCNWDKHSGV